MRDKRKTLDKEIGNVKLNKIAKKQKLQEQGITLIALVVTIIILLILAGVTLNIVFSDNGLFSKTKEAAEKYQKSQEDEQRKMAQIVAATNTELTYFQGVPIPEGFAPTEIDGESTVEEGLVITDSQGNEFVWVPCGDNIPENINAVSYSTVYYGSVEAAQAAKKENLYEGKGNPGAYWRNCDGYTEYQHYYDHGQSGNDIVYKWEDNGGDVNSVVKYGGFYVARFEAGLPKELWNGYDNEYKFTYKNEENISKNRRDATDELGENEVNYVPVSKKNTPCWNFISPDFAENASERMYSNNSSVKSQLIDSYAWDTIVEWIKDDPKVSNNVTDSTTYGNTNGSDIMVDGWYSRARIDTETWDWISIDNYSETTGLKSSLERTLGDDPADSIEIATGASEDTKTKNIYDLAGNLMEFTTERGGLWNSTASNYSCVRGGNCYYGGDFFPVCSRRGDGLKGRNHGFRVVLYLK